MPQNDDWEEEQEEGKEGFKIPEDDRMNFFKKIGPRKGDDLDLEVVQTWFKQ